MFRTMVVVDGKKLEEAFKKRGLDSKEVAIELGFSRQYFKNAIYGNRNINGQAAAMLKKLYNMDRSEYEKVDEPDEPEIEEAIDIPEEAEFNINHDRELKIGLDYDKLYQTVYAATYAAFDQVLNSGGSQKESVS